MLAQLKNFIAALCAFAFLSTSIPALADPVTILSIQSGHSIVVSTEGLTRVAVGDGRIAGVVPVGTSQIVINGKAPGHTTVLVWAGSRRTVYEVTVTEQSLDDIARMLRSSIAEPNVQIISFNRSIVLRGSVPDAAHFQALNEILSRFDKVAAAEKYTVVNAVAVSHPLGSLQQDVGNLPGASNIRVDTDAKGNVIVSGRVNDRTTAEAILARARGLAGPYLATEGKVIDRLAVDTVSQINVKVYVLEVDRSALNQLGVRLQSGTPDPMQPNAVVLGNPSFPIIETSRGIGQALTSGAFFRTTRLVPTIDLMLRSGHATLLSAPNLVTMPGSEATFLVGGEIPIPFSSGLGQTSIIFKEFGVKLKLTPTLLGNGGIETKIAPEVSDLDFQDGVSLNGFVIPALKTSRLATDVITQAGESIILGGMLRRIEQRNIDKLPVLGDLPVFGKLFRSTRYQKSETDVIFVMTPELVTR